MINHLRIKNFKGWQDSGDIRLAPLTLLFGTNSAGKTSVAQLLLMLKQTAASPDRQRPLHFGDDRALVDLGDFRAAVHGHDVERSVGFEIGWELRETMEFKDAYYNEKYKASSLRFRGEIAGPSGALPFVQRAEFQLEPASDSPLTIGMTRKADGKYRLAAKGYRPVHRQGRKWPLPSPSHFFGFPDEAVAYFQNTSFVADLNLAMSRLLESIHYVGPLREKPRRLYRWSGETPPDVGERGERAVEAILAGRDRHFNYQHRGRRQNLDILVAARLKQAGLIHDFSVDPVARERKEYEVRVKTREGSASVLLTDVGFGVSQILPVIVESFYVPPHSIVIFEQPEIHLHPAVQEELADLFIDAIHARENGVPRNVQFIIESHSEHFLRRMQRRIAEEALSPQEAALYFVHTDKAEARIEELEVDLFGNILNWPENFFGDEMADLVARSEAQARRTRAKAQTEEPT